MRAAFLDRDGTLIHDPGYLGDPERVRLLPGAAEAVRRLNRAGYLCVVVSNQSGVARGYFTEADARAVNQRTAELLLAADPEARIAGFYFCPHFSEGPVPACACRKPRPGLLLQAAAELGLDLGASIAVGDNERDAQAGRAAGCATSLRIGPAGEAATLLDAVRHLLDGPASGRQGA